MRRMGIVAAIVSLGLVGLVGPSSGPAVAAGVKAVRVANGLQSPVAFTFMPDGRLVYLERNTGWLRFRNLKTGTDLRVHRIQNVNSEVGTERGALGVAVHPAWPQKPFVYAYATRNTADGLRNQVLRIKVVNGHGVGVRRLLSIAAGPSGNHNGGRILFGPDRKLWVVVGDNGRAGNAQDLTANLRGKILRIKGDGSIPKDNPYGRIWAFGIRNSFGFAFDPRTGRLWETENGPECNDELNRIPEGGNMAWGPSSKCPETNNSGPSPRIRPRHMFIGTVGVTGAAFCDGCGLGPAYEGDLFVGAFKDDLIRRFDLNDKRLGFDAGPLIDLTHAGPVLSLEVGPNGRIYFSDFGAIYRLAPA